MPTNSGEPNIKVRIYMPQRDHHSDPYQSFPEATRYTNPLKQKFKAKRMAAESTLLSYPSFLLSDRSSSVYSSGRGHISTCPKTTQCTNARRIPTTEQDSVLAKSTRERHERSAQRALLAISESARSSAYSYEEGYRVRGIFGRRKRRGRQRRVAQLQARWREQDQGLGSAEMSVSSFSPAFISDHV